MQRLKPCHFDRSDGFIVAQWRNLLFARSVEAFKETAGFSTPAAKNAASGRNDTFEMRTYAGAPERAGAAPRILIVRVGAMGDVLHGLPAVAALRRALPGAFLGWAIEPRWSSLLQAAPDAQPGSEAMPLVDCVHPVETRLWSKCPLSLATVRSVLRLRREMREQRYDIAIDLQGSIRSAIIAKLSGARAVVGSDSPREGAARHFYGRRVVLTKMHVVEQAAEIVSAALREVQDHTALLIIPEDSPLPRDADAELWCERLLSTNMRPVVLLAPTAGWGAKEWPAERYGVVAAELQRQGYRVLINAIGANDAVAGVVVATANAALPNVSRQKVEAVTSTLPQLTALLHRAALVIAGDTGPLHLAAALGRPVVALFGPTDPARNGPFGTRTEVLRAPSSITDHRRHTGTEAGLLRIEVTTVLQAVQRTLGLPPGK